MIAALGDPRLLFAVCSRQLCDYAIFKRKLLTDFSGAAGWVCIRMRALADNRKIWTITLGSDAFSDCPLSCIVLVKHKDVKTRHLLFWK